MKKQTRLPVVTLLDHAIAELGTLERITEDVVRRKERLKNSRIFESLVHFVAQSVKGFRPQLIMYGNGDENIVDIMEEVASVLWRLSFTFEAKNFPHVAGCRIALGRPHIDSLDQVIELDQQITELGGNLAVIVCLTVNRDHETIIQLQQSPVKIICLTPVDPFEPTDLYYAPPITETNASI